MVSSQLTFLSLSCAHTASSQAGRCKNVHSSYLSSQECNGPLCKIAGTTGLGLSVCHAAWPSSRPLPWATKSLMSGKSHGLELGGIENSGHSVPGREGTTACLLVL